MTRAADEEAVADGGAGSGLRRHPEPPGSRVTNASLAGCACASISGDAESRPGFPANRGAPSRQTRPVLSEVRITGFRSARSVVFEPGPVCALVGEGGVGKSNLLAAI